MLHASQTPRAINRHVPRHSCRGADTIASAGTDRDVFWSRSESIRTPSAQNHAATNRSTVWVAWWISHFTHKPALFHGTQERHALVRNRTSVVAYARSQYSIRGSRRKRRPAGRA